MLIGEFVKELGTTKDTVRHYEELNFLHPKRNNHRKMYSSKDMEDFQVIKEMQALGFSLNDVQTIFTLKSSNGCGAPVLIADIVNKLESKQRDLASQLETIKQQQANITAILSALRTHQSS